MFDSFHTLLARLRTIRLSAWMAALFASAIIIPWGAFAWLTLIGRAQEIVRTEESLTALAAAYGEHIATLRRLGIDDASAQGKAEIAQFLRALNVPEVRFSAVRGSGASEAPRVAAANGVVRAQVERPQSGLVATAQMDERAALENWREQSFDTAIAVALRTLFVLALAIFVVHQLRVRERLQAEVARAHEKAEIASRAKSEFLANMSHELRTPLNAIIGFSEVIRIGMLGPLNVRYREYGADIAASGKHLLNLINEILDLSKLESGQFRLHEEDIDLRLLAGDVLRLMETQAADAGVTLIENVSADLPLVHADDRRIRQILINLVANAVKFTPKDGRVTVAAIEKPAGLAIEVRDTGIGIAPEDIVKALEPFGQVESKVSRKYEGTGLGLPLAKQLVEMHGGTLTIVSAVNVGTTVTIYLPRTRLVPRPQFAQASA